MEDITARATNTLWALVRLREQGASWFQLLEVYLVRVRPILEYGAPVFSGGLTVAQSNNIELTQKKALAVVLGKKFTSYRAALLTCSVERLDLRRERLSLNFVTSCLNSHRHRDMFLSNPKPINQTRGTWKPLVETNSRTSKHASSAIPYLSKLYNKHNSMCYIGPPILTPL